MLIRPPVVREMRRNLWADMTRSPQRTVQSQTDTQPAPTDQRLSRLKDLGELKASGVLTEEEFRQEKQKILDSAE